MQTTTVQQHSYRDRAMVNKRRFYHGTTTMGERRYYRRLYRRFCGKPIKIITPQHHGRIPGFDSGILASRKYHNTLIMETFWWTKPSMQRISLGTLEQLADLGGTGAATCITLGACLVILS